MKLISKLTLSIATIFTLSAQCSDVIIRPATENDLPAIHAFTKNCWQQDFMPVIAQTLTIKESLDRFIDKHIIRHQDFCKNFITQQLNQKEYRIMVALMSEKLIGYSRFFKKDSNTIQIGFLGIDQPFRQQGIAKKLIAETINTFNGVTQINFSTFSNYNLMNKLYLNHGAIKTETVFLNPNTGEETTDPTNSNGLVPYNDYYFTIKQ